MNFFQTNLPYILAGISTGGQYALIAIGYTMVYGILRLINFAHGDIIMVGAYICFTCLYSLGLSPAVGVLASVAVCTLLGILIERLAYKPLRQATSLAVLITAIGMSYFLQNLAQMIWGANPKSFQTVVPTGNLSFLGGELKISYVSLVTIAASVVVMVALSLFVGRTKMGRAMRCVSEDKGAAELMGVNVNLTISVTFAIGSALAAIAGVLMCSAYPTLKPTTGAMPGIKAFTAAVFGGIGSIPGAMLGGILLGAIEILGRAYVSSELGDAFVFAVLILVLLIKPTGLLGKKIHEKV